MNIHFRDVQTGMVEARAIIEIEPGVFLNEVTLLNIDGQLVVEFPRKNFVGKNERTHSLDIITFENEDKQVLWEVQIKQAYRDWRKQNRKVLVYEDKPRESSSEEESPRPRYRERSYDDKPGSSSYAPRESRERSVSKPHASRTYSNREQGSGSYDRPYRDRPERSDRPAGDRPARPYKERSDRPYGDRPPRQYSDRPAGDRPARQYKDRPERPAGDRPARQYRDKPDRPSGDRPVRKYADRPARPAGDRPARQYKDKPARPRRDDKPAARRSKKD